MDLLQQESSVAKAVSKKLKFFHINTGSMYRAVTFGLIESDININDSDSIIDFINKNNITFGDNNDIFLNEKNVSDKVHSIQVSSLVSKVSSILIIRKWMVKLQRNIASYKDCVLEGRDIGTSSFPQCRIQVFSSSRFRNKGNEEKERNGLIR